MNELKLRNFIYPPEDRSKEIVRAILVSKNIIKLLKEIGYLRIHEISDADNYSIIKSVLLKLFQQTRPEVKTVVRELTELTDLGFNLKSNLIDKILVDIPQHFKDEFDIREILDESFRTIKGESNHIKFHK
ncbi:43334_t:CDS:2 [Gigaspora margarita]|uniref:43334_t:CDS:1 n=1 Tax=Gigaspora margarita TaxID=4874 RepID=A0ABN7UH77_GIGMA|nr:43334_t:CDS:2 [Gigaspora margarita]